MLDARIVGIEAHIFQIHVAVLDRNLGTFNDQHLASKGWRCGGIGLIHLNLRQYHIYSVILSDTGQSGMYSDSSPLSIAFLCLAYQDQDSFDKIWVIQQ